jgi:hypothetical protein
MKYTVYVDDNYHYMDESKRYKLGEYETAAEAVNQAKELVDGFLISAYKLDMTAAELFRYYTNFGEDPFIVPPNDASNFSAWNYAKQQCFEICNELGFIDKALARAKTGAGEFDEDVYKLLAPFFEALLKQNDKLTREERAKDETTAIIKKISPLVERKPTLKAAVQSNRIYFGDDFSIDFQRTLRIPDDGRVYPLPPGFGAFPICKVVDYLDRVPPSWKQHGGVFIPMYQREALWLNFNGTSRKPNAVKVAVGKINALTGETYYQRLRSEKQDYLVSPPQEWLDGIKTGNETIRQFVAMPLGMGYSIEQQISGKEEFGGIQIIVFEAKEGKFPESEIESFIDGEPDTLKSVISSFGYEMGVAAGGRMKQKIYEDEYGIETWDQNNFGSVYIHIVDSMMFREITGTEPPPTPITAKTYAENELPWFNLYDEDKKDIRVSESLYSIGSVSFIDKNNGYSAQQDDESVKVNKESMKNIRFEYRDW